MSKCLSAGVRNTLTISLKDFTSSVTAFAPSLRFMKKMVPLIISNIVYRRIILEENLFVKRKIKDWEYMTFNVKTKHPITLNVYYWSQSIAKAIATKSVEKIYMFFTSKGKDLPIEHFEFNLESVDLTQEKSVEGTLIFDHTKKLFNFVNTLKEFKQLDSDNIDVVFEIKFGENKGSVNIPYFKQTIYRPLYKKINIEQTIMPLGRINTGYHCLTLSYQEGDIFEENENLNENEEMFITVSDDSDHEKSSQETVPNKNSFASETCEINLDVSYDSSGQPKRKRSRSPSLESMKRSIDGEIELTQPENTNLLIKKIRREEPLSQRSLSSLEDSPLLTIEEHIDINCLCGLTYSLKFSGMVTCSVCNRIMHSICVGYQNSENVPRDFICLNCGTKKRPATDIKLANTMLSKAELMCKTRLVLWYCVVNKKYPEEIIMSWNLVTQRRIRNNIAKVPDLNVNEVNNTVTVNKTFELMKFMTLLFHDVLDIPCENPESMTL